MDKEDSSVARKGKQRHEIGISNITNIHNINKSEDTMPNNNCFKKNNVGIKNS